MKLKTKLLNIVRSAFKLPPLEKCLLTMVRGKNANSFLGKLVPNNYQYKKGSWETFNFKGVNLSIDKYDYLGHFLYYGFNDLGQEKLIELADGGEVILDIGTNIGATLLLFAQKVGEGGFVYGFEPDPINYKRCRENIAQNNFSNINVQNIGLGNTIGELSMVVDTASNRGCNRLTFNNDSPNHFMVKITKLDHWAKQENITQLDLVKIDVEGFELQVLLGGRELILKHAPKLFIELDDNNLKGVGDSAKKLLDFIRDELNYKHIYKAESKEKISRNNDLLNCHFDIVATK